MSSYMYDSSDPDGLGMLDLKTSWYDYIMSGGTKTPGADDVRAEIVDVPQDKEAAAYAAQTVKKAAASKLTTLSVDEMPKALKLTTLSVDEMPKGMEQPSFWDAMTPEKAGKFGTVLGPIIKLGLDTFKKKKKQKKPAKGTMPFTPSGMSGTMKGLLIIGGLGAIGLLLYGMTSPKGAAASIKASPKRRSLVRRYYRRPRAYLRRAVRKYTRRKRRSYR